ncbi:hypothetical protein HYH03_001139 [Edaphochlamys debaryana]|uniref:Uncharacterized protein n=1 Tax=Edaphochlamys debaryana TaxID=47281 RepID=A0A835YPA0_9CHLO|nr:hypothetical protein HYH03_001139 [Edaphochlamys debaryana]|eukprot:KAG2501349.1 hypothetical protein HYH03_001139 [Edaphochlamys debaryana]
MAARPLRFLKKNAGPLTVIGGGCSASFFAGMAWAARNQQAEMRRFRAEADRYKLEADRYIARKKQETERYKLEAGRYIARKKQETERYKLEAQTERGLFDAALKQRAGRVAPSPTHQQL